MKNVEAGNYIRNLKKEKIYKKIRIEIKIKFWVLASFDPFISWFMVLNSTFNNISEMVSFIGGGKPSMF